MASILGADLQEEEGLLQTLQGCPGHLQDSGHCPASPAPGACTGLGGHTPLPQPQGELSGPSFGHPRSSHPSSLGWTRQGAVYHPPTGSVPASGRGSRELHVTLASPCPSGLVPSPRTGPACGLGVGWGAVISASWSHPYPRRAKGGGPLPTAGGEERRWQKRGWCAGRGRGTRGLGVLTLPRPLRSEKAVSDPRLQKRLRKNRGASEQEAWTRDKGSTESDSRSERLPRRWEHTLGTEEPPTTRQTG